MTDINDIKRELEALTAKVAAYEAEKVAKRNWPEQIEEGMVFRFGPSRLCIVAKWFHVPRTLMSLEPGNRMSSQDGDAAFEETERVQGKCVYLGHARDILAIRTDAHEPTGAELVGVLEDIRSVSNNPGRTLTTLGLAECLQSCNVMARKALEGLAK